jgi:hydroxyethylthiazole kinase-like uncharacterized protein yjeF
MSPSAPRPEDAAGERDAARPAEGDAAELHGERAAIRIDRALLRRWPLPMPDPDVDKDGRGRVLLVAGSRELPGAALLAGEAALRAGCGKMCLATAAGVATDLALALPEARVIGLPETAAGGLAPEGAEALAAVAAESDVLLAGPGLRDAAALATFLPVLLRALPAATPVVLDALAIEIAPRCPEARVHRLLLTPHAGEMATLLDVDKDGVRADPARWAREGARRLGTLLLLKGARSHLAAPDGRAWRHDGPPEGLPGLACSGSGDVLAGLIAGLAARGAPPEQAAAWAVALHAMAARRLARRQGPIGYLARDLAAEVPALMRRPARGA